MTSEARTLKTRDAEGRAMALKHVYAFLNSLRSVNLLVLQLDFGHSNSDVGTRPLII